MLKVLSDAATRGLATGRAAGARPVEAVDDRGADAVRRGARAVRGAGGESWRMSNPRRVRVLAAAAAPPGISSEDSVRPVARPWAMPAIVAASYSRPPCTSTCVETPPRTER